MRYCPYLGAETADTSVEHIIPESLGGGRAFSIIVDRKANSDLGAHVDAPFVDLPPIRFIRFDQRITDKSGRVPTFRFEQEVAFGDLRRTAEIEMTPEGTSVRVRPQVLDFRDGDFNFISVVGMSREAVKEQFDEIKAKREERLNRTGRTFGEPFGRDIVATLKIPSEFTLRVEGRIVFRFMAKVALASTAWLLGDDWARSSYAAALRAVLRGEGSAQVAPLQMRVRSPRTAQARLETFCYSTQLEHEVAFYHGADGCVWCSINIFHRFHAMVRVADPLRVIALPLAWGINFKTRELRQINVRAA